MASYDGRVYLFNGAPRTGKSTLADELMHQLSGPQGRGLIICDNDEEEIWHKYPAVRLETPADFVNQRGFNRFILPTSYDAKERNKKRAVFFEMLYQNYRNGTLLLDDCRKYIDSYSIGSFDNIQRSKRQFEIDIIAICHGFTEVPPVFYTFATDIWLFRTEDNPDRKIKNIPSPEKMKMLKDYVDHRAMTEPFYFYPLNKKELPALNFTVKNKK